MIAVFDCHLIIFLILLTTTTTPNALNCAYDYQCSIGAKCIAIFYGRRECFGSVGGGQILNNNQQYCYRDSDCPGWPNARCLPAKGGYNQCLNDYSASAYVSDVGYGVSLQENNDCNRDSDCTSPGDRCINNNGRTICQSNYSPPILSKNECHNNRDCPIGQQCSYAVDYGMNVCDSISTNGVSGDNNIIVVGGIGMQQQTPCNYDYQCKAGDSCSGTLSVNGRPVQSCRQDLTNRNRQCIFNFDCLPGQICKLDDSRNKYICSENTGNEVTCNYDFECAIGQKCTAITNDVDASIRLLCRSD